MAVPFRVKALYEYTSTHEDDLPFAVGQIITVTDEEDDAWRNLHSQRKSPLELAILGITTEISNPICCLLLSNLNWPHEDYQIPAQVPAAIIRPEVPPMRPRISGGAMSESLSDTPHARDKEVSQISTLYMGTEPLSAPLLTI